MSALLMLPVELLDDIISRVVLVERSPPLSIAEARETRQSDEQLPKNCGIGKQLWSHGSKYVRHEDTSTANATGLLLASWRLRRRTIDIIDKWYPNGIVYKLDVMLVNERELWPTWLHLPCNTRRLHEVQCNIRIFGIDIPEDEEKILDRYEHGFGDMRWSLYYLLERLLRLGLSGPPSTATKVLTSGDGELNGQRSFSPGESIESIGTVNLTFQVGDHSQGVFDNDVAGKERWSQRQIWSRAFNEIAWKDVPEGYKLQMNPNHLAAWLKGQVGTLLEMGYHVADYVAILYERVGIFHFSVEGSQLQTCEINSRLARMRFMPDVDRGYDTRPGGHGIYSRETFRNTDGDWRILTFWTWKFETLRSRRDKRLSATHVCLWPSLHTWTDWRDRHERAYQDRQGELSECSSTCRNRDLDRMLEQTISVARAHESGILVEIPWRNE